MVFSLSMLPPVGVSLYYADGSHMAFIAAAAWLVAVGAVIWLPARRDRRDLRLRDGFVVVTLFWTVLGLAGALSSISRRNRASAPRTQYSRPCRA